MSWGHKSWEVSMETQQARMLFLLMLTTNHPWKKLDHPWKKPVPPAPRHSALPVTGTGSWAERGLADKTAMAAMAGQKGPLPALGTSWPAECTSAHPCPGTCGRVSGANPAHPREERQGCWWLVCSDSHTSAPHEGKSLWFRPSRASRDPDPSPSPRPQ